MNFSGLTIVLCSLCILLADRFKVHHSKGVKPKNQPEPLPLATAIKNG